MRRTPHYKRASQRFLEGTRFRTPNEAVQAGLRTLEEWVMVLEEERSLDLESSQLRLMRRRDSADSMVGLHDP